MRLAVYHSLPSGGAKRALHETVRRLAADHELDFYTLSTAEHEFCDVRPFARRHQVYAFQPARLFESPWGRLNQFQRWRDLHRLRAIERRMAAEIDQEGYDVVYVQPSQWTQAPPLLHYLRTPSVYYVHEPPRMLYEPALARSRVGRGARAGLDRIDPLIALYFNTLKRLDQQATRRATRRLTNSRFTAAAVERIYGCAAEVSYFGVDAEAFRPAARPTKSGTVLSVGALRPNKGFDFVVQAVARLPKAVRPRMRLIGNAVDPTEGEHLRALAAESGTDLEIDVLVDQARLVQAYQEAALFLYAPVGEPFGLAALEAMACGTPVVAVAEGGVPETVVDGLCGRLVTRDLGAFTTAIRELLADDAQRERLGRQARAEVEARWTWSEAVGRLSGHLAQTRDARGASPARA